MYDAYKNQVAENITDDEALEPVFKKRMEATVLHDSFNFYGKKGLKNQLISIYNLVSCA